MNWEAVAAIGQAIGAVGVIVSLLYLASQVKHNALAVRSTSADAAVNALNDWASRLAADAELERLWRGGNNDVTTLPEDQRGRYFMVATQLLLLSENIHHHFRVGTLDPVAWESWRGKLAHNISRPGIRAIWKVAGQGYSRPFQEFVDSVHAQPAVEFPFDILRKARAADAKPLAEEASE